MRCLVQAYQRVWLRWQIGAQQPRVAIALAVGVAVVLAIYIAFLIVTQRLPGR
ncbi:MAG TPA: hypothetical protein VF134_01265 [Candidatus Dormibacteraeota bacterium]